MSRKILALDQAKKCGYAFFDEDRLVCYGVKLLGNHTSEYVDVLLEADKALQYMLVLFEPQIVVLEDVHCQNNLAVYHKLSMLKGVMVKLLKEKQVDYAVIHPMKWKSYLKIQGASRYAQKLDTIDRMKQKFGLEKLTDDEADAIALGHYFIKGVLKCAC